MFDYSKLLGRIKEKFGSNSNFALSMKISERSMSLKLNNKVEWKQNEIARAKKLLNIADEELYYYFFEEKVQNDWTMFAEVKKD